MGNTSSNSKRGDTFPYRYNETNLRDLSFLIAKLLEILDSPSFFSSSLSFFNPRFRFYFSVHNIILNLDIRFIRTSSRILPYEMFKHFIKFIFIEDETDSRLSNPFHDKITMDHRWSSSMSLNVFSLIVKKREKRSVIIPIHRKEDRSHRGNDWIEIFGQDHPDGSTPIHLNSIKSKAKRPKELVGGPRVYETRVSHHAIVQ